MYRGESSYPVPEELTREQMAKARQSFDSAAIHTVEAGFDGIEIYGANGYLLDQFLTGYLNRLTDEYGGSPENRVHFAAEVCHAVREALGLNTAVEIFIPKPGPATTSTGGAGRRGAAVIFPALTETGIDFIHTLGYFTYAPMFRDQ